MATDSLEKNPESFQRVLNGLSTTNEVSVTTIDEICATMGDYEACQDVHEELSLRRRSILVEDQIIIL